LQLGIGLLGQQILPVLVQPQGFGALEEAGEVGFGEHKLGLAIILGTLYDSSALWKILLDKPHYPLGLSPPLVAMGFGVDQKNFHLARFVAEGKNSPIPRGFGGLVRSGDLEVEFENALLILLGKAQHIDQGFFLDFVGPLQGEADGPFRVIPLVFVFPRKILAKMPFRKEGEIDPEDAILNKHSRAPRY
jgi:hypothetical protein